MEDSMHKRSWSRYCLVAVLSAVHTGCQLPSLIPNEVRDRDANLFRTSIPLTGDATSSVEVFSTQNVPSDQIVLSPRQSWTTTIPNADTLEIPAVRIGLSRTSGAQPVLQVFVNSKPVVLPPINKAPQFDFPSYLPVVPTMNYFVPSFSYLGITYTNSWSTFYSPDFIQNTLPSSKHYVTPDANEAYRFVWDVRSLHNSDSTMSVRIYNNGSAPGYSLVFLPPTVPMPALDLKIESPFFSPNQDGTLDTAAGSIKAQGEWKLSVIGHGEIVSGAGDAPLSWDGTVKGVKLPDGEYTLRLEDSSNLAIMAEGKVVIDTVAPKVENMTVDGKADFEITQNIIPGIKAIITDELSKFESAKNVELQFERFADKYQTKVYDDVKNFDLNSGAFSYTVPFEEDSLLYPGDQSVELIASDRAGNKTDRKFWFSVGMRNTYSGFDFKAASKAARRAFKPPVNGPTIVGNDQQKTYRLPPSLAKPGVQVKRINITRFDYGMASPKIVPAPSYWAYAVIGAAAAGAITWVFFDDIYSSVERMTNRTRILSVDTEIGKVVLEEDQYANHIHSRHGEVSKTTLADAMVSLALPDSNRGKVELWDAASLRGNLVRDNLLLFKNSTFDNLFQVVIHQKKDGGPAFVHTAFGSGVDYGGPWGSLAHQWSAAVLKLAKFMRAENPKYWEIDNSDPMYPRHILGEISDDGYKTYLIAANRSAVARKDRRIIKTPKPKKN